MDCRDFSRWLANRDMHDVSEADKALKHSASCPECKAKLDIDEKLDALLYKAMGREKVPAALANRVDLSLNRMSDKGAKGRYGLFGALSAAVAVMLVFFIAMLFTPTLPSMDDLGKHVVDDHGHHDDSIMVIHDPQDLETLGDFGVSYALVARNMPSGYRFVGARICDLGECQSIHMVFRHNGKRVSLYLVEAGRVGFSLQEGKQYSVHEGTQRVDFWKSEGYVFAMIG